MLSRLGRSSTTTAVIAASASAYLGLRFFSPAAPISANSMSHKIRQRSNGFPAEWPYSARNMRPMDDSDDGDFYSSPRFVTHIDDRCIHNLSEYYGSVLPPPSTTSKPKILDIASSWISHLPEDWSPSNYEIVGIGMSQPELSKNRALSKYLVLDLNKNPQGLSKELAGQEESYDAAICSVSIDYLTKPRELLLDLSKLLKKGATVHFAFSNRCFPTKVVGMWLDKRDPERCDAVADYLHFAGTHQQDIKPGQLYGDIEIVTVLELSRSGDPLFVVRAKKL